MYGTFTVSILLHHNSPFNINHLPLTWALTRSAGSSKRPSSKAAASEDPEAYPLGDVEDLSDARTMLAELLSILLLDRG